MLLGMINTYYLTNKNEGKNMQMFKILDESCTPTKGTAYSAGIDLFARESAYIGIGETAKIPLGVKIEDIDGFINMLRRKKLLENNNMTPAETIHDFKIKHHLELEPRSSLRAKGFTSDTGIDEIQIILHNISANNSTNAFRIEKGDKIAQIILKKNDTYLMGYESAEERTGGFGSTGA